MYGTFNFFTFHVLQLNTNKVSVFGKIVILVQSQCSTNILNIQFKSQLCQTTRGALLASCPFQWGAGRRLGCIVVSRQPKL